MISRANVNVMSVQQISLHAIRFYINLTIRTDRNTDTLMNGLCHNTVNTLSTAAATDFMNAKKHSVISFFSKSHSERKEFLFT